jgi:hypothetical protein
MIMISLFQKWVAGQVGPFWPISADPASIARSGPAFCGCEWHYVAQVNYLLGKLGWLLLLCVGNIFLTEILGRRILCNRPYKVSLRAISPVSPP